MGFGSDWAAKRQGAAPSPVAQPGLDAFRMDPGPIGGFIASAASSIPEMFGADPSMAATTFRAANPKMGFVSEMLPTLGAYGLAFKASKIPQMAKALDDVVGWAGKKTGLDEITAPVRMGMVREAARYTPFELSRLAVGGMMHPENFGDLFADVALSTALTGGAGGLGGFFRAGGKKAPLPGKVVGADLQLTPSHQMKMILDDNAAVAHASRDEMLGQLRREIFSEETTKFMSGKAFPYVNSLVGAKNVEEVGAIGSAFKPKSKKLGEQGLHIKLLEETEESNLKTLNAGEQEQIAKMAGFADVDSLAKESIFPRVAIAEGKNGARALGNIMNTEGLQRVAPGTFMGRERDGAFVIFKQLGEVAEAAGKKGFGSANVKPGSQWLVTKTTNPAAFAPEVGAIAEGTMARWAKWKQVFQPSPRSDNFNSMFDMVVKAMNPKDFHDLARMSKGTWHSQKVKELSGRLVDASGLQGSKTMDDVVEYLYDTFKPTMFKQHQNALYGRLEGLQRAAMRRADGLATRIMQGATKARGSPVGAVLGRDVEQVSGFNGHESVASLVKQLTPQDANTFGHASAAGRLSTDDLGELVKEGLLSAQGMEAIEKLKLINKDLLSDEILPVFREQPHLADVAWMEDYVMPRAFKGEWRVPVRNEAGQLKYLASGKNGAEAQAEAKLFVDEAAQQGKKWTASEAEIGHILDPDAADLDNLMKKLPEQLSKSDDDAQVIYGALRKLASIKGTQGKNPSVPLSSGTLKSRTGVRGGEKHVYTHQDIIEGIDGHTRTLLRFTATQAWRDRFGSLTKVLEEQNPTMYKDLMRKSQQYLGIEGQLTNYLNKALTPVLGSSLGSKAATKIAAAANETMYLWNLALVNPTFALLNLLTPLQTVAPWVAMMTRAPAHEAAKMNMFVPVFDNAGKVRGSASIMEPMKVLKEAVGLAKNPTEELRGFIDEALDDGTIGAQLYEDWIGTKARASATLKDAFEEGGWIGFMRKGSTYLAEKSEQLSRLTAFNSAYLVGKNHFGLEGDQLYRFMRRGVEQTMFNYGTVDRSRIFTGPIGSMFGLFKNWQMHFIGTMANYAGLAMKENVWSPLLWQMGAAGALGGLGATPLRHIADGLANWHNGTKDSYLWMMENWGREAADAVNFGLPSFLGISLQASSSIPGTDVRNEISNLGNFVILERMKRVGAAMGDAWSTQTATGESGLHDPNVRDQLLGALLPRAFYKAISAVEGDYVKSMASGSPQVRDLSPSSRMMQFLGFNPLEIERYQIASKRLYADQEQRREMVQGLGAQFANAAMEQDTEGMQRVIARALVMQLPIDSIMQSAQTRQRRESESDILSRYDKDLQARWRASIGK